MTDYDYDFCKKILTLVKISSVFGSYSVECIS